MIDIVRIGAIVTAASVIAGTAWAIADYTDTRPVLEKELIQLQRQAEDLSQSVLSVRFWLLMDRLKINGQLTLEEQRELCKLAKELQYIGIPGCPSA